MTAFTEMLAGGYGADEPSLILGSALEGSQALPLGACRRTHARGVCAPTPGAASGTGLSPGG